MLFFLQCVALAHEGFILAAGGGVRQESINALADAGGLDLLEDRLAQLVGLGFDFSWHNSR